MKLILASEFSESYAVTKPLIEQHRTGNKLLFIATAAYAEGWEPLPETHHALFDEMGFDVTELDLAKTTSQEARAHIATSDVVFVTGGNTFCLLEAMQKTNMKGALEPFFEKGGLYIGYSAGSIVMSPDISFITPMDEPEKAPNLTTTKGLSLITFSFVPHAQRSSDLSGAANIILENTINRPSIVPLYTFPDHQALFIHGNTTELLSA